MKFPFPQMTRIALIAVSSHGLCSPVLSQEQIIGPPSERADLAPPPAEAEPEVDRACLRRQEAAMISGEIIVCGERARTSTTVTYDRERAQRRHANKTRNAGTLPTPDVAGAGIFRGKATFSLPPPTPALMIDVTGLPEAPPGSDADRIGRGLAPLGNDADTRAAPLPPAPQREDPKLPGIDYEAQAAAGAVSPAGSAAPEGPQ